MSKWTRKKEKTVTLQQLGADFWMKERGTGTYCPFDKQTKELLVGLAITSAPTRGKVMGEFQIITEPEHRSRLELYYEDGTNETRNF